MKTIYPFMGLALCSVTAQAQEKPNFLIIQCDHLTQRVVGAYGQTQGCTLPIDEVASRGVIFSNAYVGCPLSQPSRAALWSGMMPHQTNVRSNSSTSWENSIISTIIKNNSIIFIYISNIYR
jgi:choline-sulfatase